MQFVFCADLHLRIDKPRCRTDEDWFKTQKEQLNSIFSIARFRKCPVVIGGDIFHTPRVQDEIKIMFLEISKGVQTRIIAGQHDIPYHSWIKHKSSSWGVLLAGSKDIMEPFDIGDYKHYNTPIHSGRDTKILITHELVFESEKDIPSFFNAKSAKQLLNEHKKYDWILCGDNHNGFHFEEKGRHVIMSGCMNRQAADMKNYEPKVWLIDTDKDKAEAHYLLDNTDLVTDEYIKEENDREERITSFIETIKGTKKISLDYIENIRDSLKINKFTKEEEKIIFELIGEI